MSKAKSSKSVSAKTAVMAFVMIVLGTVVIGVFGYFSFRNEVIDAKGEEARTMAQAVAYAVNGDKMQEAMDTMEHSDYWYEMESYVDQVKTGTDVEYLYVINKNEEGHWRYFVEGRKPGDDEIGYLGEVEPDGVFAEEADMAYETGQFAVTDIDNSEGFGYMVSGFAPVFNSAGSIVGVAGVDISVDEVNASAGFFGMITLIIIIGFSVCSGLYFMRYIRKTVGNPIEALSVASRKIAEGDMDIDLSYQSDDEIGILTNAFYDMVNSTQKQVEMLEQIAGGDLTVRVEKRGENDHMAEAMIEMADSLKSMVHQIRAATEQVLAGSKELASGASALAQGSIEQTTSIAQLSDSISDVTDKTKESAEIAEDAARLASGIQADAEEGTQKMENLTTAVREIGDAGDSINKIIKTIDDIAFQTNILALNAAVEAARAGEHGKGFAVVADEVRNLAQKSADAAKETSTLITDSNEKSKLGVEIAESAAQSLAKIVEGIGRSYQLVNDIAGYARSQSTEIEQINAGIEQVSQVTQQNSATAQQTSAASQEMSGQSEMLQHIVERFEIGE
ncbi:MAG: methyl-accepting chemotaxis protein [Christensenellaceae bacterium]|jgi:methyl-accepting chemotaxis protein